MSCEGCMYNYEDDNINYYSCESVEITEGEMDLYYGKEDGCPHYEICLEPRESYEY